jgi:acyl-CoA thioester hydrolase
MYEMQMQVQDEHIDFQNIMDGLFYPYYMETCRHQYIKDVLGIDIVEFAKQGLNLVLAEYTLKFRAPLKKGVQLTVTCQLTPIESSRSKFAFTQQIICNGKPAAEGFFTATCVPAAGGRPFIPEEFKRFLNAETIE